MRVPKGWNRYQISEILERVTDPIFPEPEKYYSEIGIRSHGKGLFHKEPVTGKSLGNKRVFRIHTDCFVVNIVFAWEQAIGKTTISEVGMIASHRFPMFQPKNKLCDIDYLTYFFKTSKGKFLLGLASPGGAGRNKTLGQNEFAQLKITIPPTEEQQKIAQILSTWDKAIEKLEALIAAKLKRKKSLMQQLLTGKKRFSGFGGEWHRVELGALLDYKQPTLYLVESTEYRDGYLTPVLTAGKTFILGYTNETFGIYQEELPVIIFDDFTTDSKFVEFPFKAKSSAMKILTAKQGVSIKYVFEAMQVLNYTIGGHQRHWISIFSNLVVALPSIQEQQKIASVLSAADREIEIHQKQLSALKQQKKGLMQQLLSGKKRVKIDLKEVA